MDEKDIKFLNERLFKDMAHEIITKGSKDQKALEWTEFKYVKIRYKARLAEAKVFIENFVVEKMREIKRLRDSEDARFYKEHPDYKPNISDKSETSGNASIMTTYEAVQ